MTIIYTTDEAHFHFNQAKLATNLDLSVPDAGHGEIALLCDRHGCDKGSLSFNQKHPYLWLPHTYAAVYERLLAPRRHKVKTVFECGVGSPKDVQTKEGLRRNIPAGASLRVWQDYFPQAQIWGADIDPDVLFQEGHIHTGYMDQTDADSVTEYFTRAKVPSFDLMIDDGLHTAEAAICLFSNASPYLAADGIYFIEDMNPQNLETLYDTFKKYLDEFAFRYVLMSSRISTDNNLVAITRRGGGNTLIFIILFCCLVHMLTLSMICLLYTAYEALRCTQTTSIFVARNSQPGKRKIGRLVSRHTRSTA